MTKTIKDYQTELKKVNKELETERTNLIYMLKHINIENINLLQFHFKFNELLNKQDYLKKIIFNMKY